MSALDCKKMWPKAFNFRCVLLSALCFFLISNSFSQNPTPTPERDPEIVSLLASAQLAAPELAADTFLKVAASKRVTDSAWRKEILEQASQLIQQVKYPVRKHVSLFGVQVDSVSGYMTYAYDQELDALSLKSRLIKQVLAVDRPRAKQIVFEIGGNLNLRPLSCEDSLAYDVADIYRAVGDVAKVAFSKKEINEGVRAVFLLPWIENIQSPAQITPIIKLLREIESSFQERQMLGNALTLSINRNFHDDRSFTYALAGDRLLEVLAVYISYYSVNEKVDFRPSVRDFLAKNFTSSRCLDNKPRKNELPEFVGTANSLLYRGLQPFVLDDFDSVEYKGIPEMRYYLRSKMAIKFDQTFRSARDAKNAPDNRVDAATQQEWELKVSQMLEDLDSWKESDEESEIEVFNQKCVAYRALTAEVAPGPLKTIVLRRFVRYLADSPVQKQSFIEWLNHVSWLIRLEPRLFSTLCREIPNLNFRVLTDMQTIRIK